MKVKTTTFDETAYLAANPDVAAAVRAGTIDSGKEHYSRYGLRERRPLKIGSRAPPLTLPFGSAPKPTRRDKILANLDPLRLQGCEIGALAAPLVRPDEGRILFVDHVDTQTLRTKYAADPAVNTFDIVDVDAVWGRQTLQDCIGVDRKVDYVVASHVIEHVPDLITWLAEIRSILRPPRGTLRLAVPDRRYTFDLLRFESRIHDVLDAYLRRARAPLPRVIVEGSLIRAVDCRKAWNGTINVAELKPYTTTVQSLDLARDALANGTYYDSHCWVFTPVSFSELCIEMAELDLLGFACEHHIETPRNELEFYVHMIPSDDKAAIIESWARMRTQLLKSSTYQKPTRYNWVPLLLPVATGKRIQSFLSSRDWLTGLLRRILSRCDGSE